MSKAGQRLLKAATEAKEMAQRPYDYGTHECLDRTFLVMEMLSYVSEHPQVKECPEWEDLVGKAHSALWDLYQAIGQRA
jgi:hypothetical protein